jgi:sugar lactone lactonase YvrE
MHAGLVNVVARNSPVVVTHVRGEPGGLGWTSEGSMLIVSMHDRRLVRLASGTLDEIADLSEVSPHALNDMLVDTDGRAYIGTFGFDGVAGDGAQRSPILLVQPNGAHVIAAADLEFPNGMALTDGGRTLVVAESLGSRLTAFTRQADGTLTKRRVWASLPDDVMPDGICIDDEGSIWVASVTTNECLLVREGGAIVRRVGTGQRRAIDCVLGGDDGRTLYIATNRHLSPRRTREAREGRIEAARVEVGTRR